MNGLFNQIKERINKMPSGSVFIVSDFIDICSKETANRVILRLIDKKIVCRIIQGLYYKAKYSKLLNEYVAPDPNKVAQAIARNYGWTIVPYGDTALNTLGLSTQVPSSWTYVSDGTYRQYKFGNTTIMFKKTANRNISKLSYKTALLIQALKALGKENIDQKIINNLKNKLNKTEKKMMIEEAKFATSWTYESIKQICKEYKDEKNS